jgi:nicotinate-nucleotide adenylyltransferase
VSETLAIFGGSFNPPHVGHVLAVTLVLSTSDVDRVLVVPTFRHPFAKALAPYGDRVTMCELAMGWLPRVEISRVEEELGGDSLTLRTLEHLRKTRPSDRLRLVMGADLLLESSKWFRFDDVRAIAPPLVIGRAGVNAPGAPAPLLPEISSTEVRERIGRGDIAGLDQLVPRAVLEHVKSRGLYAGAQA